MRSSFTSTMRHTILFFSFVLSSCAPHACPDHQTAGGEAAPRAGVPAEVRALADAPRRASPPGTATIAMLAQGRNAFIGRLEMEAGAEVPEHQDPDEEYVVVLEGSGTITIDGVVSEVTSGSTIFM